MSWTEDDVQDYYQRQGLIKPPQHGVPPAPVMVGKGSDYLIESLKGMTYERKDIANALSIDVGGGTNKYHVADKPDRTYNGILFASKKEAQQAKELDLRVKAGEIDYWIRQVSFILQGGDRYIADFVTFKGWAFHNAPALMWLVEVIEAKGMWTPLAKNKFKRFKKAYLNLQIRIV